MKKLFSFILVFIFVFQFTGLYVNAENVIEDKIEIESIADSDMAKNLTGIEIRSSS